MRLPVRARITAAFAAGIAVVLVALAAFVYVRTGSDLLDAVDSGLRSRADVLAAEVRARGSDVPDVEAQLIEPDESFAQVATRDGTILRSSRIVSRTPLLDAATIARLGHAVLFDRTIPGIDNVTRVLATPVRHDAQTFVLMVGSSLQDRQDQLITLGVTLAIGGVCALTLLSFAGWLVVGAALRPVDRMRREADEISKLEAGRRLAVPPGDDEFAALASTLNAMLERLQTAFGRELRFVDDASHELRTPIAVVRGRLEVALSRPRTREELEASMRDALADAEHLSRLADDLLVLSRSRDGRIPIRREPVTLPELLAAATSALAGAAETGGVEVASEAPRDAAADLDPIRVRQLLENLLANAIRHTPPGGSVRVTAAANDGRARIVVEDSGDGFPDGLLATAFEPFVRGPGPSPDGAGLGLAIVKAVAEAHGGGVEVTNRPEGGARITVTLRSA
jgi:two-component system, OmpR family, sensor kinase